MKDTSEDDEDVDVDDVDASPSPTTTGGTGGMHAVVYFTKLGVVRIKSKNEMPRPAVSRINTSSHTCCTVNFFGTDNICKKRSDTPPQGEQVAGIVLRNRSTAMSHSSFEGSKTTPASPR